MDLPRPTPPLDRVAALVPVRGLEGAKARQNSHWDRIAKAEFDQSYVEAVTVVGKVHARIGLEPRWYIGGYALITDRLIRAVIADRWPSLLGFGKGNAEGTAAALSALMKAVMLYMDLAISTYLDALD